MKKIIFNILVILFCYNGFCINDYPYVKIFFISSGENENQLQCHMYEPPGGHGTPTTYAIGNDNKIYIADDLKKRIAIYDIDGNYLSQIKNSSLELDYLLEINAANNILYCLRDGEGPLIAINKSGEMIFKTQYDQLSRSFYTGNGFFNIIIT